jgi:hypothetical protein
LPNVLQTELPVFVAMLLYCQHEMHTALELWSWLLDFL